MNYTATISRTGGYRPTGAAWRESHREDQERIDAFRYSARKASKEEGFQNIAVISDYVDCYSEEPVKLCVDILEMLNGDGDLTNKQLEQVKRIQARVLAENGNFSGYCGAFERLDQYIESRKQAAAQAQPAVKKAIPETAGKKKFTGAVKSGLVALANRLTKTMTRKEAFIEAWKLFKAGSVKIPVAGVTFGRRQEALARLQQYPQKDIHCVLVPEPENEFDKDAVAVMAGVQNGKGLFCIGYVPRTETGKVKALTAAGKKPALKVICAETNSAQLSLDL